MRQRRTVWVHGGAVACLLTAGVGLPAVAALARASGTGARATAVSATRAPASEAAAQEDVMIDMAAERDRVWYRVDDDVMGGASRSGLTRHDDGYAIFSGRLSLENRGGFASVRTAASVPRPEAATGLVVRVRGDGRRYQLRLRTDRDLDGTAYRAEFAAPGEWAEVRLPFGDFVPTFRGRILDDAPPLDPAAVQQLAFMIADRREGAFRLDVVWVRTYWDGGRAAGAP